MNTEKTVPENLVLYHYPCLDGFTAAWVAYKFFGDNAEYRPANYAKEPVTIDDVAGRIVYLLDFSMKADVLRNLARYAHRIIILDHHHSAEANIKPLLADGTIEGEFDMTRSGALMAWDYFFPHEEPPAFVEYVSDRDLWQFKLPRSKEVNAAMFSYDYSFDTWDDFWIRGAHDLATEGATLRRQFLKDITEIKGEAATRMNIAGHNVPVVNANHMFGSELCSQLAEGEKFAAYYWVNSKGLYVFGLRSTFESGFDVAEIASLFGGGGHKTASGFRVSSLDELNRGSGIGEH
jgi:oligoribonuclease NrnB/cAMP/cGMP phosphodiesterase (DHH superfamily)